MKADVRSWSSRMVILWSLMYVLLVALLLALLTPYLANRILLPLSAPIRPAPIIAGSSHERRHMSTNEKTDWYSHEFSGYIQGAVSARCEDGVGWRYNFWSTNTDGSKNMIEGTTVWTGST